MAQRHETSMSEDLERNKSVVRRFFDTINRGDHGALDDLVADQGRPKDQEVSDATDQSQQHC